MLKEINDKYVLNAVMTKKAPDECDVCSPVKPKPVPIPEQTVRATIDVEPGNGDGGDGGNEAEEEFPELSDGEAPSGDQPEDGSRRIRKPTERFEAGTTGRTPGAKKPKAEAKAGKGGFAQPPSTQKRGRARDDQGNAVPMRYAKRGSNGSVPQVPDKENGERAPPEMPQNALAWRLNLDCVSICRRGIGRHRQPRGNALLCACACTQMGRRTRR